jgi:hypothetical protein
MVFVNVAHSERLVSIELQIFGTAFRIHTPDSVGFRPTEIYVYHIVSTVMIQKLRFCH